MAIHEFLPCRNRIRIRFEHGGSFLQQTGGPFHAMKRGRHVLLQDGIVAAVDCLLANLLSVKRGSLFVSRSSQDKFQARSHLDQVGDGHGDGMDGPFQVGHGVAIFRFFVQDHQPLNLKEMRKMRSRHSWADGSCHNSSP